MYHLTSSLQKFDFTGKSFALPCSRSRHCTVLQKDRGRPVVPFSAPIVFFVLPWAWRSSSQTGNSTFGSARDQTGSCPHPPMTRTGRLASRPDVPLPVASTSQPPAPHRRLRRRPAVLSPRWGKLSSRSARDRNHVPSAPLFVLCLTLASWYRQRAIAISPEMASLGQTRPSLRPTSCQKAPLCQGGQLRENRTVLRYTQKPRDIQVEETVSGVVLVVLSE